MRNACGGRIRRCEKPKSACGPSCKRYPTWYGLRIWAASTSDCNPKFERLFSTAAAQIIGKTDYDFVDQRQADSFREKDALTRCWCVSIDVSAPLQIATAISSAKAKNVLATDAKCDPLY